MVTQTPGGPSRTPTTSRRSVASARVPSWRFRALPDSTLLLSQFYVTLAGEQASEAMMLNLVEATVENSLHLPDVATLVLHDPSGQWVDDDHLSPGTALLIEARVYPQTHLLFDGEIVELESDFSPGGRRVI